MSQSIAVVLINLKDPYFSAEDGIEHVMVAKILRELALVVENGPDGSPHRIHHGSMDSPTISIQYPGDGDKGVKFMIPTPDIVLESMQEMVNVVAHEKGLAVFLKTLNSYVRAMREIIMEGGPLQLKEIDRIVKSVEDEEATPTPREDEVRDMKDRILWIMGRA